MLTKFIRKGVLFFILNILLILQILVQNHCAVIIPPEGGLRDSLPPLLLKATPGDSTKNFKGNRISFLFDEFVDLQNVQENLIVSPTLKNNPTPNYKLNTVTVRLKDTLEPNTTYSINFGNAIKDVNEGNVLRQFTYVFSTGSYIDSLQLKGRVLLAETGKPDSTLIAILHTSGNDSAIIKERPRYITRLDSSGNFTFKNLPPATYYLYALKDEGNSHRYLGDQLLAFADKPINTQSQTEPITFYAFASEKEEAKPQVATTTSSSNLPGLNLGGRNRPNPAAEKRLRYQTNLTNNKQDLLTDFIFSFDQPLKLFDTSKIHLYTDSTFTPVTAYSFVKDSANKKVQLTTPWKEATLYHLILDKDFAEDTLGRKLLKTDTLNFTTNKTEDYGSLKLKLHGLDLSKNPVLQFVSNNTLVNSFPLTNEDFSQTLFLPGEYELRILFDKNKNGKWDTGEFFGKHQQPEIVQPLSRHITVKKNWQNEFDINL